jgi:chromosome partitioning protein
MGERPAMSIIAIANQKGGVGKTTLTVHLAAYLAAQGYRAVVVDCDPQGNASSWVLGGDTTQDGLFQLLVVCRPAVALAQEVGEWGFRILSGNHRTGDAFVFLAATGKPFDTVAQMLRPLAAEADYLLVDMPPSKGAGFRETLFAADWVLVPTQLERLSLEGVAFMSQTCGELVRERGHGPRLLGVVPNMARRQTIEHRAQMDELVAAFGAIVWPPIPLSVRVAEACAFGTTLFKHAPDEPVTDAIRTIGQRLIKNLEG